MRIAYFVHDLSDAAVLRRVRMLRERGAEVTVLGFRRTAAAPAFVHDAPAVDLGRSFDGRLGRRALGVVRQVLRAPALADVRGAQVVLARSLEMLVVGDAARRAHAPNARLAYECLDVHRLMVSPGPAGRLLRALERAILRRAQLLIVSSPAHLTSYFEPRQGLNRSLRLPVLTVENKVFELPAARPRGCVPARRPGPPWRIGWFGMLRCRRSLELLSQLARRRPGQVEVVIGGRPSEREFADFEADVARTPGMIFAGAYAPEDLEALYGSVHFSWAIDYFEEGANSRWLLPNRLYEGGRYGAAPIALKGTEVGRWLEQRGLGLVVEDPLYDLERFFGDLDAGAYRTLEEKSRRAPPEWFRAGTGDCGRLLQALGGLA
ncbi:MAG: glycosyl transferase family 1 [Caulobacteraceae bacterium]|nr:glycosyl transferase family 1 [Caulobacteraceae bacterium]